MRRQAIARGEPDLGELDVQPRRLPQRLGQRLLELAPLVLLLREVAAHGGAMVEIPEGEFMMGCNEALDSQCGDNEYPYHAVDVPAFAIVDAVRAGKIDAGYTPGGTETGHDLYIGLV